MTKTEENLKLAFEKESQASQRYRAFSKRARKEGYPNIARLFKLTSEVERIHAQGDLNALNGVGSTSSMLKQAISDNHKAKLIIENNIKSKEAHAQLYFTALVSLNEGRDLTDSELYLCPFCGNIISEKPGKNCSICDGPVSKFIQV